MASNAASSSSAASVPNSTSDDQVDNSDSGSGSLSGSATMFPPGSEEYGYMLNAVFANYFSYNTEGRTLNVADILLLLRQSIDDNTRALRSLAESKKR